MPLKYVFWVIFIVAFLFSVGLRGGYFGGGYAMGGTLVEYALIGILGWATFGPAVQKV
jgi:hypothetical protein